MVSALVSGSSGPGSNLMPGVTLRWTSIPFRGGIEILLVASCYRNREKLRPDGPLGSSADFTYLPGILIMSEAE